MKLTYTVNLFEENLLKYVPKKMAKYVTVLYKHSDSAYSIYVEIDGEEYHGLADGVAEIRYAVNTMVRERRDYGM